MFLKFFDICWNKHGRWSQKFAVGVTKLLPPDEIRRLDGILNLNIQDKLSYKKMKNEENQQNWSEVQKKKIHAREKFNKARKGKKNLHWRFYFLNSFKTSFMNKAI